MCREFAEQFHEVVALEDNMMELLAVKQGENETLREFINRYHRAVLDLGAFNHPKTLKGLKERVKIESLWYNLRSPTIQSYYTPYSHIIPLMSRRKMIKEEKTARLRVEQLESLRKKEKKIQKATGPT